MSATSSTATTASESGARPFVNIYKAFPAGYQAMLALDHAVVAGPLDPALLELVKVRASQLNGCAYCIDMHYKDARAAGETEARLYMLNGWREATVYTEPERAALALTEAVTLVADAHVPAEVEELARAHFDDASYACLLFAIVTINAWNRLAIAGHSVPGVYQPAARIIS